SASCGAVKPRTRSLGSPDAFAPGTLADTPVQPLSRRRDLTKKTEPVKIERDLVKIIPKEKWILFSHQLILHGRAICVARQPKCPECKIAAQCYAHEKALALAAIKS